MNEAIADRILIKPMTSEHMAQVHQLLTSTFRSDEPMNKNVGLTEEDCRLAFADFSNFCLSLGVSFVAVDSDTDNVVGVRLSSIKERTSDQHDHEDYYQLYPKKMATLLSFLDCLGDCLFEKVPPQVQKVFKFEILCVKEDCRRHGIAKKSVDASMALAKQLNFDAISTTATSFKTQTLFEKMGFVTLNTITFEEYKDKFGEIVFHQMPQENLQAKLMVKYLKNFSGDN